MDRILVPVWRPSSVFFRCSTLSQVFCGDLLLTNAVTGVWFWVCWVHLICLSVFDLRQQRDMLQLHNKYWHLVMGAPLSLCGLRIALAPLGPWHFHTHLKKNSVWKTNNLDFDGKCRTSIDQHKKEESLNIIYKQPIDFTVPDLIVLPCLDYSFVCMILH